MITEEQARKKWCPFARDSLLEECRDGVTSYSFNRAVGCGTGKLPENCLCIASDCMHGCDKDGNWRGFCGLGTKP